MNKAKEIIKSCCQYCDEPIKGRSDKRFCNSSCRAAFHNDQNENNRKVIKAVNKVLLKNYRILTARWENDEKEISQHVMIEFGFNFNYFTSIQKLNNGATYFFCYDLGFSKIDEAGIRIIKKEKVAKAG
jgi:hypothetical protein